jgi:cytochrome c oxidase assembly protein subunit 15
MFTFPPSKWVGGILFEHTHRLMGALVGMLSIGLTAVAWGTDGRRWVRWTAIGVLLAVCVQGTIGGLRVVLSEKDLAIVHGCAAQIFFCFIASFCVLSSRFWAEEREGADGSGARRVMIAALVATAIILGQLVVGAIMRHSGAGLAIPDFPTSYGNWLPPTHIDAAFRDRAIHQFGYGLGLNRVTLFQIWIHFSHRVGALLVSAAVISLAGIIFFKGPRHKAFLRPGAGILVLLVIQVTLGVLTVLLRKPADIASAHVAVGSLLLVSVWVIAMRGIGVVRAHRAVQIEDVPGEIFARPSPQPSPGVPGEGVRGVGGLREGLELQHGVREG